MSKGKRKETNLLKVAILNTLLNGSIRVMVKLQNLVMRETNLKNLIHVAS